MHPGPGPETTDSTAPDETVARRTGRRLTAASICAAATVLVIGKLTDGVEERTDLLGRFASPSWRHPLGTDQFGRDVLALVGAGMTSSIGLASVVVALSAVIGTVIALLATSGRYRRVTFVSAADVLLAIPMLVVALVVAATLGAGTGALVIALSGLGWTPYFRLVLAHSDASRQQLWVEAAVASGARPRRVLWRHILPNVAAPLIAMVAVRFGHAIVSVSSLSFLGVGPQPPSPEWGATLAAAQPHAERAPWAVIGPSAAIVVTTAIAFVAGRRATEQLTR